MERPTLLHNLAHGEKIGDSRPPHRVVWPSQVHTRFVGETGRIPVLTRNGGLSSLNESENPQPMIGRAAPIRRGLRGDPPCVARMRILSDRSSKGTSVRNIRHILVYAFAVLLMLAPAVPAQGADPVPTQSLIAGWLARTLASTDNLAHTSAGDVDYASTAYSVLSMRGAGVAGDQIKASATALAASKEDFISTPGEIGQKTTAIALVILAMEIADLNPSQFAAGSGTRDLYADLESAVHEDGSISDMPSAYGQSFVILALLGSDSGVPKAAVDWLLAQPCVDETSPGYGGFGFSGPGSCDDVDPDSTALAVIALVAAGVDVATIKASGTYLSSIQETSGGFVSPWSGANANTTGLAVAALKGLDGFSDEVTAGVNYLTSLTYGCDVASTAETVVGAMAFDSSSRAVVPTTPLAGDVQASLFQASAQGLFGFVGFPVPSAPLPTLSAEVPDASLCTAVTTPGPTTPEPDRPTSLVWLWWTLGGIAVVGAILVWRFLPSRRV